MFIGTTATNATKRIQASVEFGGNPQPLYANGVGTVFVAGSAGQAYTLRVRNLTTARLEVVASIDQRDTQTDSTADLTTARGVVIRPQSDYVLRGWRLDSNRVSEFVLGSPEQSIASQAMGSISGVGVIGFAVYTEQVHSYHPRDAGFGGFDSLGLAPQTFSAFRSAVSHSKGLSEERYLGTGRGNDVADPIGTTFFHRMPGDPDIMALGYNSYEVLDAMGLIRPGLPNPFPAKTTGYGKYSQILQA